MAGYNCGSKQWWYFYALSSVANTDTVYGVIFIRIKLEVCIDEQKVTRAFIMERVNSYRRSLNARESQPNRTCQVITR